MNPEELLPVRPPSMAVLKSFLCKLRGDTGSDSGCVLWAGETRAYKDAPTYPTFRLKLESGKRIMVRARNVSYCWLLNRRVHVRERLKTTCNNGACVNPHHVRQGAPPPPARPKIRGERILISKRKSKAFGNGREIRSGQTTPLSGGVHKKKRTRR